METRAGSAPLCTRLGLLAVFHDLCVLCLSGKIDSWSCTKSPAVPVMLLSFWRGTTLLPLSHDVFGSFPPLVAGLPAVFTAVCFCLPSYSLSYPRVGPPLNGHYSRSLSSLASTRRSTDQPVQINGSLLKLNDSYT